MLSLITGVMIVSAVICGIISGNASEVFAAASEGAENAITMALKLCGAICLWSGIMELMSECGISDHLSKLMKPLIRLIFGKDVRDTAAETAISRNMAANMLGLGNAATPSGLEAAGRMFELSKRNDSAPHGVFMLMVLNSLSLQILPTTVAVLRQGYGAADPFDIILPVWVTSGAALLFGLISARCFRWAER